MELRQLRYFVSIVDLGSFTKAAEDLFITQPTLSWNMRKLEEEFGVPLLERHFNGVQLTEMGNILYEGSRRILDLVDSLQSHMHNESSRIPQEISLGVPGIAAANYRDRIDEFNQNNQPLKIKQVIAGSNYIQEQVMSGDMDVGIVVSPEKRDHLKVHKIMLQEAHYPTAFVVHKDSKYADAITLAIDILKDEDFASLSKNYKIGTDVFYRCLDFGFMPNIVARHESWEALVEHVANYKSVTLLPLQLKERSTEDNVVWIPLNDTVVGHYQQYLIWRDDNQKLNRFKDSSDFKNHLEEV